MRLVAPPHPHFPLVFDSRNLACPKPLPERLGDFTLASPQIQFLPSRDAMPQNILCARLLECLLVCAALCLRLCVSMHL